MIRIRNACMAYRMTHKGIPIEIPAGGNKQRIRTSSDTNCKLIQDTKLLVILRPAAIVYTHFTSSW